MLGLVCFMCPGLFNALNGLGASGQVDSATSANANAALYAAFACFSIPSGSINNQLGSRLTLLLGTTGYALYVGSYLALNIHPQVDGFVIAAGVLLGISASLLWTAQGSLILSYPTESQKGRFISIFWCIYNLGGVVGAAASLALNFKSMIAFLILTMTGVCIPALMVDPNKMCRTDGTQVLIAPRPSWKVAFYGLWVAIKTDPFIIMLFPMFFASNWAYTWEFNNYNRPLFTIRARSLNNLLYWIAQIIGSLFIGFILDHKRLRRRIRAFSGWSTVFIVVWAVYIWAYFYERTYTRESVILNPDKISIGTRSYVGHALLYILCGSLDSMTQIFVYWIIGAMSNDPAKLAQFMGLYKSIQSAGAAGIWRVDAVKYPFMNIFVSAWILVVAGLMFSLPMIYLRVKDSTDVM
ncbi:hypothetical protein BYT27DRAFT_7222059 [Phlegmacium glaucopus]|nr:hypothetical protein BYT27DRAFT_7222059 [Phlegmacium glaucopus]